MVAGGVLFGTVGAVAGSIVSPTKTVSTTKHKYEITFVLDDMDFIGFTGEVTDKNVVLRIAKQIEALRRRSLESNGVAEKANNDSTTSNLTNADVESYGKAKEEMKRLGMTSYDEYLDFLEFTEKRKKRGL